MSFLPKLGVALIFLSEFAFASDEEVTRGDVSPITLSPDGRLGITVPSSPIYQKPDGTYDDVKNPQNAIIEIKTGKVFGVISGDVGFEHMNHDEVVPTCWTSDDSTLLWLVDSKWGFRTEMLIGLKDEKIVSQVDILTVLQQEILKRTREASPKDYAAVKAKSSGFGSWFHDGFAVDCVLDAQADKLTFPIPAKVFLTSNTKSIEGKINLDSRMNAEVNQDGTIKVTKFYLGQDPPARDWLH